VDHAQLLAPSVKRRHAPRSPLRSTLHSDAPKVPSGPEWIHQVKHDGYRLRVRREDEASACLPGAVFDRSGRYPAIVRTAGFACQSFTLAGEAVACGGNGPAIFADLHRRWIVSETILYAFFGVRRRGLAAVSLSDWKRLLAKLIGRRSLVESNAADAIMPRLSPSRSRVLILPTQEFGGMSVCRASLRSGGRVRSRRRYQCRRTNYHLASSGSGIRRRPRGAVSCRRGGDRRHHHDCREASDQTHQGFILVRESPECNIGASWRSLIRLRRL
jgi:hypothetical protein